MDSWKFNLFCDDNMIPLLLWGVLHVCKRMKLMTCSLTTICYNNWLVIQNNTILPYICAKSDGLSRFSVWGRKLLTSKHVSSFYSSRYIYQWNRRWNTRWSFFCWNKFTFIYISFVQHISRKTDNEFEITYYIYVVLSHQEKAYVSFLLFFSGHQGEKIWYN